MGLREATKVRHWRVYLGDWRVSLDIVPSADHLATQMGIYLHCINANLLVNNFNFFSLNNFFILVMDMCYTSVQQ